MLLKDGMNNIYNEICQKRFKRQQNYMSVHFKEKVIDYNEGHFYRANPYSNQGYIPTASLKNRKQPEFATQIPQGLEYFQNSSKKHFIDIIGKKNNIVQQNLLSNPQKFPLENRLAQDINYHRNLNTIDIDGASANSKKSMGLRNRIKAQQQLKRRNAKIITPILTNGLSEEDLRRKLAEEQLIRLSSRQQNQSKNRERNYHSEKKLPPPNFYARNPYEHLREEKVQLTIPTLQKEVLQTKEQDQDEKEQSLSNPQIIKLDRQTPMQIKKRYVSDQNIYKILEYRSNPSREMQIDRTSIDSSGSGLGSSLNIEIQQYYQKQRRNIQKEFMNQQFKMQHRHLNPTHLSYEGTIVKNSSIFSNLGKNITLT